MIEDIKFIKTDKEGIELQTIQEFYPNSIIDVNSQSEKNVYIGTERITDNYNLGVDENSITNNVGGMTSGINASELKGKSVSEILDIILFASNNNLTLKGVQVVDKIANLTDDTLEDVYIGMVVSVVEDNSLYILLSDINSDSDGEREWKKVGSDINIEEIKTSVKKLSAPITVAGLSGSLGNITNGKTYTTDNTVEDILRDILCKEIYPSVSLSVTNPSLSFGGIKIDNSNSNYQRLMEVGSVLNLGSVTLNAATISNGHRVGSGFAYGYSFTNDGKKDGDNNPPKVNAEKSLVGNYSLSEIYSPEEIGTVRSVTSSENYSDVKFGEGSVKIALGNNTISITAKSPSGKYTHPEYPEYYVVSNLGNTDEKLEKSNKVEKTLNAITDTETISVKGVYPVYVNINTETNKLVSDPIKMDLTDSNVVIFDNVPSEVDSKEHFKFDYPATHSVVSFEATDVQGNFVNYDASHEKESNETITKVICGENVSYKRLQTTGSLQGEGVYKITLSKSLDE